jgi:hypothetical protein
MIEVKCYGGPLHNEYIKLDNGCRRFETVKPRLTNRAYMNPASVDLLLAIPPMTHERMTYYLHTWRQPGITEAGFRVYREMQIALLEGTDLLPREKADLDFDLRGSMWIWPRKPNFLKEFDQWFEHALFEVTGKPPRVYYA